MSQRSSESDSWLSRMIDLSPVISIKFSKPIWNSWTKRNAKDRRRPRLGPLRRSFLFFLDDDPQPLGQLGRLGQTHHRAPQLIPTL